MGLSSMKVGRSLFSSKNIQVGGSKAIDNAKVKVHDMKTEWRGMYCILRRNDIANSTITEFVFFTHFE